MSRRTERVNRTDREGKEAMHRRLQELRRKKRPLDFLLDEEEMDRLRKQHTLSPVEKLNEQEGVKQ